MKTVMKVTLALALVLLLAGCSAVRFAYESADSYLLYRAKGYLDLDERSSQELESRIDQFFAWHRRNALPQYARIAEDAAKRVGKGLSREDLVWGYDAAVAHARQSLRVGRARAVAAARKLLEADPKAARAHSILGRLAMEDGDRERAIREFEVALLQDPEDAEAKRGLKQLRG